MVKKAEEFGQAEMGSVSSFPCQWDSSLIFPELDFLAAVDPTNRVVGRASEISRRVHL